MSSATAWHRPVTRADTLWLRGLIATVSFSPRRSSHTNERATYCGLPVGRRDLVSRCEDERAGCRHREIGRAVVGLNRDVGRASVIRSPRTCPVLASNATARNVVPEKKTR